MSKKSDKTKFRIIVFILGSFIVSCVCVIIFLFATSYEQKENIITAPLQGDLKIEDSSEQLKSNRQETEVKTK
ncbi:hypothetical protein [Fluviispira multicolorata]|uniref:Uncharacterized protein n=1 Tax=Fluviispira multicolorata TaxID=2654512 RepID=A0A833N595_9BACT|nr:hypothetical protein [Fluviispira multicolorata]KAB8033144.1 hypothetical protein GCL57_00170 [Fluviispira multicolorata]